MRILNLQLTNIIKDIPNATSIINYVFKFLDLEFNGGSKKVKLVEAPVNDKSESGVCTECGGITYMRGTCFYCDSCGSSSGCS